MSNLTLPKDQITLTKKIAHVIFESSDDYHKAFAKHLCDSDFSVLDSWNKAWITIGLSPFE